MVNNLAYNEDEESLYLLSGDKIVGDKVSVRDMLDDGIPVVDMDSIPGGSGSDNNNGCNCGCEDNVVEFGYDSDETEKYGCNCGCEDNVVEFGYSAAIVKKQSNDSNITEF